MKKHDAKIRIEAALLALVDEYRFSEITVGEIIARANVNRSTFYYHYIDKFALRDAIVEDMMSTLCSSVPLGLDLTYQPDAADIVETVRLLHARKELFLRLNNPNWEVDTSSLAINYFAGLAAKWAAAQPQQYYDPELFAELYAASALNTVLWAFRKGVDEDTVANIIADHLRRGFFQAFVNPKPDNDRSPGTNPDKSP